MSDQTMSAFIYIDGEKRRATPLGTSFYVDHPSLPGRYCGHHSLPASAVQHLYAGGAVRTSGHRYSLSPDKPAPAPPVDIVSIEPTPSLLRRIWARIRNF